MYRLKLTGQFQMKTFILVIKHGALGDFITATAAFKAIRQHHINEKIILLTSSPYVGLAKQSHYFDDVWIDDRASFWRFHKNKNVLKIFRNHNKSYCIKRVYDLQSSNRTGLYFKALLKPKPEWLGNVKGCSHPRPFATNIYSTLESNQRHFATIGIDVDLKPDVSWINTSVDRFNLPEKYALIIPGCSLKNEAKRWTVKGYVSVIEALRVKGITPVLIGGEDDKEIIKKIVTLLSEKVISLFGKTSITDIVPLARKACLVFGGDTGPVHMSAATGCQTVMLFSQHSLPPELCAPRGSHVHIIKHDVLATLPEHIVIEKIGEKIG